MVPLAKKLSRSKKADQKLWQKHRPQCGNAA
jgi:hypothetical protein